MLFFIEGQIPAKVVEQLLWNLSSVQKTYEDSVGHIKLDGTIVVLLVQLTGRPIVKAMDGFGQTDQRTG
jgi:hypothetical protein